MPAMRADIPLQGSHFIDQIKKTLFIKNCFAFVSGLLLNEPKIHGYHTLPGVSGGRYDGELFKIIGIKMFSIGTQRSMLVCGKGTLNAAFEQGGISTEGLLINEQGIVGFAEHMFQRCAACFAHMYE
jgi:hypothetical protein